MFPLNARHNVAFILRRCEHPTAMQRRYGITRVDRFVHKRYFVNHKNIELVGTLISIIGRGHVYRRRILRANGDDCLIGSIGCSKGSMYTYRLHYIIKTMVRVKYYPAESTTTSRYGGFMKIKFYLCAPTS